MKSIIFEEAISRTKLPFFKVDEPVPIWKIIKKSIGQDITKISLPVVLNEPISLLQRISEGMIISHNLLARAAITDDPVMRLALTMIASFEFTNSMKIRKKKPFNPMLGETFELVSHEFRIISEKVAHHPV